MEKPKLIVAALALAAVILSWVIALRARMAGIRFRIVGEIEIINSCDGKESSLPNQVTVSASLNDAQGRKASGTVIVGLTPAPIPRPNTARVVGNYSITDIALAFPAGFGTPVNWDAPVLTLVGGGNVCASIPCPAPGRRCTSPGLVPQGVILFVQPTTRADIRILCDCA